MRPQWHVWVSYRLECVGLGQYMLSWRVGTSRERFRLRGKCVQLSFVKVFVVCSDVEVFYQ